MIKLERRQAGFTLIELMLAVAIIGILVAIAYPSYQQHVYETRRTDARTVLMETAQRMERCYSSSLAYNDGDCSTVTDGLGESPEGFYDITPSNLSATSFTLTATAQGGQTGDEKCRTMRLDQSGSRAATAADGTDSTDECW